MDRKRLCYALYSAAFFAACLLPGLGLLRSKGETSTAEKRQLAAFPPLRTEEGTLNTAWGAGFTAYVSDRFGGREALASLNSNLQYQLLHTSAEEDVIVGADGWLYYTPTVRDFQNIPTVTPLGMQCIVQNLALMRDEAEASGCRFSVMIVPNKSTVYPEHMPGRYTAAAQNGNLENLREGLQGTGLWIPAAEALTEAKASGEQLYHRTDTHWNNTGALVGYRTLTAALGREASRFDGVAHVTERSWNGDLYGMLFPGGTELDEQAVYDYEFSYRYLGRYRDSDDLSINTACEGREGSLLMFRDSFGAAMIPYLSEEFGTARYSRVRPYPLYQAEGFDDVVLEIVERNIPWLLNEAPMHAALPVPEPPAATETAAATLCTELDNQFQHLHGLLQLPEGTSAAPLYTVTLTAQDGTAQSYRAYNCCEADLNAGEAITDNGYSLYLPAEALVQGERYSITVTAELPGRVIGCEAGELVFTGE